MNRRKFVLSALPFGVLGGGAYAVFQSTPDKVVTYEASVIDHSGVDGGSVQMRNGVFAGPSIADSLTSEIQEKARVVIRFDATVKLNPKISWSLQGPESEIGLSGSDHDDGRDWAAESDLFVPIDGGQYRFEMSGSEGNSLRIDFEIERTGVVDQ